MNRLKQLILGVALMVATLPIAAQTATQVLDKVAAKVQNSKGVKASFTVKSAQYGNTSGTLLMKGKRFQMSTPQAKVWFDGKTQWSYMAQTNEVNISTPTQAQQMAANPYSFLTFYKTGYKSTVTKKNGSYVVHLVADNQKRTVQELYITVAASSYTPSAIRMKSAGKWTDITVSSFSTPSLPNTTFVFPSKDFPKAEVVDLR